MFKRVDNDAEMVPGGFSYFNRDGYEEAVVFVNGEIIRIGDASELKDGNTDGAYPIYLEDIPMTIKALQAAYDYKRSERDGYK